MSDVSARPGPSPDWTEVLAPYGGSWMVLLRDDDALVVAPPAVALCAGEARDAIARWRIARWPLDRHGWMAPALELAAEPVAVRAAEVLLVLGPAQHGWVETIMRLQLAQCEAFATAHPGGMSDEERSRGAAELLIDLLAELRAAFPGEDWYKRSETMLPQVPETVADLLAAIDGAAAQTSRESEVFDGQSCRERVMDELVEQLRACRMQGARALADPCPYGPTTSRVYAITHSLLTDVLKRAPATGLSEHGQLMFTMHGLSPRADLDPKLFDTTLVTSRYGALEQPNLALAMAAWPARTVYGFAQQDTPEHVDLCIERSAEQAIWEFKAAPDETPLFAFVGGLEQNADPLTSAGALLDIPGWGALVRSIAGDTLPLIEAFSSEAGCTGLPNHLLYRSGDHPHRDFTALLVRDAIEQRSSYAVDALADEWTWLSPDGSRARADKPYGMVFRGSVVDQRTNEQGRLVVFASSNHACSYMLVPHGVDGDLLPYLHLEGAYPSVRRALAEIARLRTGRPSAAAGTIRARGRLYAEHLSIAPDCRPASLAFAVAANVSAAPADT